MKREIDLQKISDGRLYGLNDMVKADCDDCKGCSACCRGMGESIVLDPWDVFWMGVGTGKSVQELLETHLELHVVDGVVLPNLRLAGEGESCLFLDGQGRCIIHRFRPGICRLFPLGRIYEDRKIRYFLQIHECEKQSRSKVKVKKWLDVPQAKEYEQFVVKWHYLLTDLQEEMERRKDYGFEKECSMEVLQLFYLMPYDWGKDFYVQFWERYGEMKNRYGFLL